MENNYHIRQIGLIDPAKLTQNIVIVGGGSIGGWTSLGLVKLGCKNITVVDFDSVEEQNIGPQLFNPSDIGKLKVEALRKNIAALTGEMISIRNERVDEKWNGDFDIYISALDNIKSREDLLSTLIGKNGIFIDGRMEANEIQVYIVHLDNPAEVENYKKTLFKEESVEPIACSMRSVVYNCLFISGMITDVVAHIANGDQLPFDLEADLKNFELYGGLISGN